jgi:hypothetical protein
MYKGTIIENSLADKKILQQVQIIRTYKTNDWILHDVIVAKDKVPLLSKALDEGPWYIHLWLEGSDDIRVIFKNRTFWIKASDPLTWKDAIKYGKSISIPEEQLDFKIND